MFFIGIIDTIIKIKKMGVNIDDETWNTYIFPHCDLNDYTQLIANLKREGFTVKDILTPILVVLMKQGRLNTAVNVCKLLLIYI